MPRRPGRDTHMRFSRGPWSLRGDECDAANILILVGCKVVKDDWQRRQPAERVSTRQDTICIARGKGMRDKQMAGRITCVSAYSNIGTASCCLLLLAKFQKSICKMIELRC